MSKNSLVFAGAAPVFTLSDTRFGPIRSTMLADAVWFVAADVCKALGLSNTGKALANITASYVGEARLTKRGGRLHKLVSEEGLHELVFQSRKAQARAFKRFLASEVIPSLLKHGMYVAGQEQMDDAELAAAVAERGERLLVETRAERHARIAADSARFREIHGRSANAKERYFLAKP